MLDFERNEIEKRRREIRAQIENGDIDEAEYEHLLDELAADERDLDQQDGTAAQQLTQTHDLSASGGPLSITTAEIAEIAARAKAKVKASARGWSMLSQIEIIALAFIADVFLADGELPPTPEARPAPAVISTI